MIQKIIQPQRYKNSIKRLNNFYSFYNLFSLSSFKMMNRPIINGADLTMLAIWQAF